MKLPENNDNNNNNNNNFIDHKNFNIKYSIITRVVLKILNNNSNSNSFQQQLY